MKIGIYGGTFDPPHLGHMESARAAMAILELDQLLFLPAHLPPHKELSEGSATPEQRLEMTALMADGLGPKAQVCDLEYSRDGKSYTADTLRQLRKQYPADEFWLLMGADMFLTLQHWREPEALLAMAKVAAFARTEGDGGELLRIQGEYLQKTYQANCCIMTLPAIRAISSTQLRGGEGWEQIYPPVLGYILRNWLYGTHVDLAALSTGQLRACALSMVKAKRVAHILGTEETAVKLALRWGADPELARRAAILHDCTKYWSRQEHLDCCQRFGVELDDLEQETEKLLHAKTGACMAKYVYGQPQEVYDAIFYHTTGKSNMTKLEKIIYLADYMEPNREFPQVTQMRRLTEGDLDAALLLGCELNIAEMEERGYRIHHNTLQAYEWLKGNCQ